MAVGSVKGRASRSAPLPAAGRWLRSRPALGLLLAGVLSAAPLQAVERWSCRNELEVLCDGETCRASARGEFTPLSVRFDTAGRYAVCAYSGCWEGVARLVRQDQLWLLSQPKAAWLGPAGASPAYSRLVILFDRVDRMALLKVEAFQLPLRCGTVGDLAADD